MSAIKACVHEWFRPQRGSLLSPGIDFSLAGGISVLAFFVLWWWGEVIFGPAHNVAWITYYLAFLVNYPHFTASYVLLYRDLKDYFITDTSNRFFSLRLWWAGAVVPVVLLVYFLYALSSESLTHMGYLVNAMFFFVGWHYVKQAFGCTVVLSAARQFYFTLWERRVVLFSLYMLWGVAYVSNNLYFGVNNFFGIPFTAVQVPAQLQVIFNTLLIAALGAIVVMGVRRFYNTRMLPPAAACVTYGAIFIWLHPLFADPRYFLFIPFFHSLQYLLFVTAYKKNQAAAVVLEDDYTEDASQIKFILTAFVVVVAVLFPVVVATVYLLVRFQDIFQALVAILPLTWLQFQIIVLVLLLSALWVGFVRWHRARSTISPLAYLFVSLILLGALLFHVVPMSFDFLSAHTVLPSVFSYNHALFGAGLYLFFFTIFINIHHYFVDNVIWRRDNPNVRAYLYAK